MNKSRCAIAYDFDGTLTSTDTIKFTVLSLLIHRPLKIGAAIRRYQSFKHGRISPEEAKHTIIGMLIDGRSSRWVQARMGIYKRLVRTVRRTAVWNEMIGYKKSGAMVLIATASPQFAVEAVMTDYSIPVIGTCYEQVGGRYTGRPLFPIPFRQDKAVKVRRYLDSCGTAALQYAFSDSLDDIPLLSMAHKGYLVQRSGKMVEVK